MRRRPKTITKIVNQVISRKAETKYLDSVETFINVSFPLNRGVSQSLFSDEYKKITYWPAVGTANNQRIGDVIQNCYLKLTCMAINYGTVSAIKMQLKYRIIIFSYQNTSQTADIAEFFQYSRNTQIPLQRVNKDNITVYYDRIHDISAKNPFNTSATPSKEAVNVKTLTIGLKLGKKVTFGSTLDTIPKQPKLTRYIACLPHYYNNADATLTSDTGYLYWQARLYYKDM